MPLCTFIIGPGVLSPFVCDGIPYPAFSGDAGYRNDVNSCGVAGGGPIPLGTYHIIDRQSGGTLGGIRDWAYEQSSGVDRSVWFALYRDDGTIDDQTFVGSVRRGEFRLHPKGPSGSSLGCVVIENRTDFNTIAAFIRGQPYATIPGTSTRTYGTLEVAPPSLIDILSPRYRRGKGSARGIA